MKPHRILLIAALIAIAILLFTAPAFGQEPTPIRIVLTPTPGQYPPPPYSIDQLTPAVIAAAVASITALIFRYVPGASDWFSQLQPVHKQWFMFAVSSLFAIAIGLWNMAIDGFTPQSLVKLLFAIFAALSANQTTYQFIKRQT